MIYTILYSLHTFCVNCTNYRKYNMFMENLNVQKFAEWYIRRYKILSKIYIDIYISDIFCLISFVFLISWINSVSFFCILYKLN